MQSGASTRVLVVEDEPIDAVMVRRSLCPRESEGAFEVLHAATLEEGLERLGDDAVDALLVDLGLPDSDGLDTVVRLRRRAPHVPLVVLTGNGDSDFAARTLAAGADRYLVKGEVEPQDLRRALHQAVARQRVTRPDVARDVAEDEWASVRELRKLQALVVGNAQMLRDDARHHPALRSRAEALLRAARIAALLTERLFARTTPAIAPDPSVDLSELVRRAEPLLRAVLPEPIELTLDLAEGLASANAPVEQVLCALLELVANAVDAIGDSGGRVEVRTGASVIDAGGMPGLVAQGDLEAGPRVWFEVRDTGGGFDSSALFGELGSSMAARALAHDYGRSHLEEIVAEHGAAMFVHSRPGAGATFRILLRPAE